MNFLDEILKILKEKHEEKLDFKKYEYHLFLVDAHILVYLEEKTKTIKVEDEMIDEGSAKVFFDTASISDFM